MQPGPNTLSLLLLKAFSALDAMQKGKATRAVFATLGQQLIICDELCTAGFAKEQSKTVREAHAALVCADWDARSTGVWKLTDEDYEAVRSAVLVYENQLSSAPHLNVREAEQRMLRLQLNSGSSKKAA
jgi:hypothetical protein